MPLAHYTVYIAITPSIANESLTLYITTKTNQIDQGLSHPTLGSLGLQISSVNQTPPKFQSTWLNCRYEPDY
ncbi:hypothetical protein SORBI_3009G199750 [Sorghum bicolor]|uniref:Uncharacterized protein n=1 Tax=Sorghum bicolor TaxID=4558 RepID=A0A1Z5R4E6_SORBI|nr:hypothetical protein SORBI_3009G199750 [Sorghum bicolor]